MTIRYFGSILLCVCAFSAFAQSDEKDSLFKQLARTKEDTTRIMLLIKIGHDYVDNNLDSGYAYANQALRLSQKIGYRRGESLSFSTMGAIESFLGNYPEALKLTLRSLPLAEQNNDTTVTLHALNSLGAIYYFEKDYKLAQAYFFKCASYMDTTNNFDMGRLWANIGETYLQLHMLDSALIYTNMGYKSSADQGDQATMADELDNLGSIYAEQGRNALAHHYFKLGLAAAAQSSDLDDFCEGSLGAARLFKQEGRTDSALAYAYQSITAARSAKLTSSQLEASNFIESVFESGKMADSSLKYLKLTVTLQDSLYSQEKSKAVQNMTFEENIRQQDLTLQKKQAEDNAVKNRQLILIALFIPIFFLIVVFLARIKVKPRVVEFLAIVNLLLFFEFITDVTFPYISDWTHDSPAWEMLILVLIAAGIEPLNYRIERWVKVKLTRRTAI
jgi:tetratricopeptide (TPR) repeat protein